jgi:ligand-binding sensor domain-containing protein
MTEEKITMKAIVVTDQAAGRAGMKLVERPEPQGARLASLSGANYGDVVVQVHASGFTWDELEWPSTWIDRLGRDRTPSIPGHETVQQLVADSQGDLWILLETTKILRYHRGKFELGREEAEFGITAITKRLDGGILLSSLALGPLTYHDEKFEIVDPGAAVANFSSVPGADELSTRLSWATGVTPHRVAEPNSAVISMAQSSDGKLWLGTRDKGLFYMSDGKVFSAGKMSSAAPINCLLVLSNRELWVGTDRGLLRWNGTEITTQGVPPALARLPVP